MIRYYKSNGNFNITTVDGPTISITTDQIVQVREANIFYEVGPNQYVTKVREYIRIFVTQDFETSITTEYEWFEANYIGNFRPFTP